MIMLLHGGSAPVQNILLGVSHLLDKENIKEFLNIFSEPYSYENAVKIYKLMNNFMDVTYLDSVEYAKTTLKDMVKNSTHLTVEIFIEEIQDLYEAAIDHALKDKKCKVRGLSIQENLTTFLNLIGMTLIKCADGEIKVDSISSIDRILEDSNKKLEPKDIAMLVIIEDAFRVIIEVMKAMLATFYSLDTSTKFVDFVHAYHQNIARVLYVPLLMRYKF